MKHALLPLLFVFSVFISCSSGSNDLARSDLKGKVKTSKELQFDPTYENSKWVAGTPSRLGGRIVEYDRDGFFVKSYTISSRGDTLGISTPRRENGELVEEAYHSLYDRSTTRTMMDRVGADQVNFEVWKGDVLIYEGANYFDKKGRTVRQVQVNNGREVNIYSVYEKDLLVEHYQEEITGQQTAWQHYEYDGFDRKGNWTVKLVYTGAEKIKPVIVITRELEYWN